MLPLRLWYFITGCIEIRVHGPGLEHFMNLAITRGLIMWDIRRRGDILLARVGLAAFTQLRPLAQQAGCRLRFVGVYGLPRYFRRLRRRRALPLAAFAVVVALVVFTRFVWFVQVTGVKQISEHTVLKAAAEAGLKPGVLKHALDLPAIEHRLTLDLAGVSWAKVRFQGTRAIIDIVEKVRPQVALEPAGPGDIVAARDGLISKVLVLAGEACVREGDTVVAGQVLILGPPGAPAGGEVKATVWYQAYCEVPLVQMVGARTGRSWIRETVVWDGRELVWKGRERVPFEDYEVFTERRSLPAWRNIRVPVELVTYTFYELQWMDVRRTAEEALACAHEQAIASVRGRLPPGAVPGELSTEVLSDGQAVGVRATLASTEQIGVFRPHPSGRP